MTPGAVIYSTIGGSNKEDRTADILDALKREGWAFVNIQSPPLPDQTPQGWCDLISRTIGSNDCGTYRCGAVSEVLARVLSLSGYSSVLCYGRVGDVGHVWVEVDGVVYDPTAAQFDAPVYVKEREASPPLPEADGEVVADSDDLTAAYMAGFERGKDAAREKAEQVAAGLREEADWWQPIVTAPKGSGFGTFMMLAFGPPEDQTISEGMYFDGRFYAASIFYVGGPHGTRQFAFREHEVQPTHWRPTLKGPAALRASASTEEGKTATPSVTDEEAQS